MYHLTRITIDPTVMGGKPCIRGMRITVGTIVGLIATGKTIDEVLSAYPYLEREDVLEALIQVRIQNILPEAIGELVVSAIRQFENELGKGALISIDPEYTGLIR